MSSASTPLLQTLAIASGASVGALLRWRLGVWLNSAGHWLPWGTLLANWLGAYAIGVAVVFFQHHTPLDPVWRLPPVTGLLGGLTPFSSFSAEAVALLQHGRWGLAASHSLLHVLGSLLLTGAGMACAQAWWPVRA